MNKKVMGLALSLVAALGASAPAFAADDNLDKVVSVVLIPTRIVGAVGGTLVGVPVGMVRHTHKRYLGYTSTAADKIHGKENGPANALVSFVTLPASMVVGGAEGTYYGVKNGATKGFNAPFTFDSAGFGELDGDK